MRPMGKAYKGLDQNVLLLEFDFPNLATVLIPTSKHENERAYSRAMRIDRMKANYQVAKAKLSK